MRRDYPYLEEGHGGGRLYVRRAGRRIRIEAEWGTPGFAAAYVEAMDALSRPSGPKGTPRRQAAPVGTLGWLAAQYFGSPRFTKLDPKSQATRRGVIEECLREPRKQGSTVTLATYPLDKMTAALVIGLMDRKADLPGAANNRKKYLSAMFGWAVKVRHIKSNPARDAERVSYATAGFEPWTLADVAQFEVRHSIGTKARLALAILLHTGARRGDVVTFGRQHVRDGVLRYVPRKTRYKRHDAVKTPVSVELAAVISASPCGDLTFLVTDYGKPFTHKGFGARFQKWCDEAGIARGKSAHGLRKLRATLAAEGGATDRQLMAMFGWSTAGQATVYTKAADQERLAAEGSRLVDFAPRDADCPAASQDVENKG